MATIPARSTILCVDDETNVVEGLALILGRKYEVLTATSGLAALDILKRHRLIPVVISDMRMPGMDGSAFLAKVKDASPLTVRMLLTGQSDLDSAISAINFGQIFRFLLKPIPPPILLKAVESAIAQHQLLLSERVLLEKTLRGSIKLLTELLALSNPLAFGRASRIKQSAVEVAERLQFTSTWEIEVAAQLSHISYVSLPHTMVEKIYTGAALDAVEEAQLAAQPALCDKLLAHIPRLDGVRAMVLNKDKNFDGSGSPDNGLAGGLIPIGARILKIAFAFDTLESQGHDLGSAMETLRSRPGCYDDKLLDTFLEVRGARLEDAIIRTMPLNMLQVGMKFAQDVRTSAGVLLIPRGQEVTDTVLERIKNFPAGILADLLPMLIPRPQAPVAEEKPVEKPMEKQV